MAKFIVRPFGGPEAVDWAERINTARMREERLAKAQASLKKHGIAARPHRLRTASRQSLREMPLGKAGKPQAGDTLG